MTPKTDGFRALSVKHPKHLLTRAKKATKLNLAILSSNPNSTHFDLNTQCLMRQDVQLLSQKFNYFLCFFFFFFYYSHAKVIYLISHPLYFKIFKTYTIDFSCYTSQPMC
jgi:hypothetical protein